MAEESERKYIRRIKLSLAGMAIGAAAIFGNVIYRTVNKTLYPSSYDEVSLKNYSAGIGGLGLMATSSGLAIATDRKLNRFRRRQETREQ